MGLITKSDCMSVTVLNQTVRYICHVVDVCSKLHKVFNDYCLFSVSDQLVVGIVFGCFWLKNRKKTYFCVTAWPLSSILGRRVTQVTKNCFNAHPQGLHECKIPQQICESW